MEELHMTSQQGATGALLFLDLDHLKSINDRYGHALGDEALRCAGLVLARYQSQSDFAGRLGGEEEEFELFQSDLAIEQMRDRCQEIRGEIAGIVLIAPPGAQVRLSTSTGACYCIIRHERTCVRTWTLSASARANPNIRHGTDPFRHV